LSASTARPIEIGSTDLVLAARSVEGSLTGSAQDGEDTLNFSVLQNIRSMNEIMPLEEAAAGYARMSNRRVSASCSPRASHDDVALQQEGR